MKFISCSATGPRQWITVYSDGGVRLHAKYLGTEEKKGPFRTLVYKPKLRSDREAVRRLVYHLNLLAAGCEGEPCEVCDCYE